MSTVQQTITNLPELLAVVGTTINPAAVRPLVFASSVFLQPWWHTLGQGEIHALVIKENDDVQAIVPSFLFTNDRGQRQLSLIGCVDVADYLDIWVKPGTDLETQVSEWLTTERDNFDVLSFCSLPNGSPTIELLQRWAAAHGHQATVTQQDICPVITLPATWDEYLQRLGKKQRHEIKRKSEKLFREQPAEYEELRQVQDKDITDFIHLHQASSQEKSSFWDEKHEAFFRAFLTTLSATNWLRLSFLKIGGVRVATMVGFVIGGQYLLYNSGFAAEQYRQYGIGAVLTAHTIETAIQEHCSRFDFLRGDEEYKFRFGAVPEPVWDVRIE